MSEHRFHLAHFTLDDKRQAYYWVCRCGAAGRKSHADPLGAQADWAHHVKVQQRKAAKP